MLEYAYDLASRKIVVWFPQTKIVQEVKGIFADTESEIGADNLREVMTDEEKNSSRSESHDEIKDLIKRDSENADADNSATGPLHT